MFWFSLRLASASIENMALWEKLEIWWWPSVIQLHSCYQILCSKSESYPAGFGWPGVFFREKNLPKSVHEKINKPLGSSIPAFRHPFSSAASYFCPKYFLHPCHLWYRSNWLKNQSQSWRFDGWLCFVISHLRGPRLWRVSDVIPIWWNRHPEG